MKCDKFFTRKSICGLEWICLEEVVAIIIETWGLIMGSLYEWFLDFGRELWCIMEKKWDWKFGGEFLVLVLRGIMCVILYRFVFFSRSCFFMFKVRMIIFILFFKWVMVIIEEIVYIIYRLLTCLILKEYYVK